MKSRSNYGICFGRGSKHSTVQASAPDSMQLLSYWSHGNFPVREVWYGWKWKKQEGKSCEEDNETRGEAFAADLVADWLTAETKSENLSSESLNTHSKLGMKTQTEHTLTFLRCYPKPSPHATLIPDYSLPTTTSQSQLKFLELTSLHGSQLENSSHGPQWRQAGKKSHKGWRRRRRMYRKRLTSDLCVLSVATAVSGSAEHKSHKGELSGPAGKTQQRERVSAWTKILLHSVLQYLMPLGSGCELFVNFSILLPQLFLQIPTLSFYYLGVSSRRDFTWVGCPLISNANHVKWADSPLTFILKVQSLLTS